MDGKSRFCDASQRPTIRPALHAAVKACRCRLWRSLPGSSGGRRTRQDRTARNYIRKGAVVEHSQKCCRGLRQYRRNTATRLDAAAAVSLEALDHREIGLGGSQDSTEVDLVRRTCQPVTPVRPRSPSRKPTWIGFMTTFLRWACEKRQPAVLKPSERRHLERCRPVCMDGGYFVICGNRTSKRFFDLPLCGTASASSRLTGDPTSIIPTIPIPAWGVHLTP